MGNEISSNNDLLDKPRKGPGLQRSNSLRIPAQTLNIEDNSKLNVKNKNNSVKRSNTFSSVTLKRPVIFQRSEQKTAHKRNNSSSSRAFENNNNDFPETDETTNNENNYSDDELNISKASFNSDSNRDNNFVVSKSPFSFKRDSIKVNKFEAPLSNIDECLANKEKEIIMENPITSSNLKQSKQSLSHENLAKASSSLPKLRRNSAEVLKRSNIVTTKVDLTELKSSRELIQEKSLEDIREKKEDSREEKKRAISRRKNRYVRRSQSMRSYHELLPRLLSGEGLDNLSEFAEHAATNTNDEELAREIRKARLGPRRISDTCLVKEHHVNKSEQFTQMLKELREKAINDMRPLSPYAVDLLSDKKEKDKKEDRKFKFEKHRDYFDQWLKNQNERINDLARACEADDEFARVRKSFRERKLKVAQTDLLPVRPHSVKLPRRNNINKTYQSFVLTDSDHSDNEKNSSNNTLEFKSRLEIKKNKKIDVSLQNESNDTENARILNDDVFYKKEYLGHEKKDDVSQNNIATNKQSDIFETSNSSLSTENEKGVTEDTKVDESENFENCSKNDLNLNIDRYCTNNTEEKVNQITTEKKELSGNDISSTKNLEKFNVECKEINNYKYMSEKSSSDDKLERKSSIKETDMNNNNTVLQVNRDDRESSLKDLNKTTSVKNITTTSNNMRSTKVKITSRKSYPSVLLKPAISTRNEIFLKTGTKFISQSASPLMTRNNIVRNIAIVKPFCSTENKPLNTHSEQISKQSDECLKSSTNSLVLDIK